ncbi:MAG: hypothetical protein D6769_00705 [Methanobacteriota archaeon]|nr:MAG: hypothetical protein D6769_00705 [Euryarchaeota archaeon]
MAVSSVDILSEKSNSTIGRKEYTIKLMFKGATPKRSEIKDAVIAKIASNPDTTVVKRVEQLAGKTSLRAAVFVYDSPEIMKRVEPYYMLKREGFIEEKKDSNGGEE